MSKKAIYKTKNRVPLFCAKGIRLVWCLSTSATRLSRRDPWLSVLRLLGVWHCRSQMKDPVRNLYRSRVLLYLLSFRKLPGKTLRELVTAIPISGVKIDHDFHSMDYLDTFSPHFVI
jgi:hypothetical protein